jgi:hypothetical protein
LAIVSPTPDINEQPGDEEEFCAGWDTRHDKAHHIFEHGGGAADSMRNKTRSTIPANFAKLVNRSQNDCRDED